MAIRVGTPDLPSLVNILDEYLPEVIRVQSNIRSFIKGDCDGQTVWVDQWPNVKAVVCVTDCLNSNFSYLGDRLEVFTCSFHSLVFVLRHEGVVNWGQSYEVAAVSKLCKDAIAFVAQEKNSYIKLKPQLYMYFMEEKITTQLLKSRPIKRKDHEKLKFHNVDISLTSDIIHNWNPESGMDGENYIQSLIHKLPSVALYNKDDHLIGYCLLYYFLALGVFFVNEEYRGKGYGEMIAVEIIKKLRRRYPNQTPHLVVVTSNSSAIRLYEKLGFVRLKKTLEWFYFRPNHKLK